MAHDDMHLDDALELAALVRPAWAQIRDAIPAWHPRLEGEDGGDGGDGGDAGAGDGDGDGDVDWKAEARKHERRAKQERRAREAAEAKVRERGEADKTEQQKAIDRARREAADAAKADVAKDYRQRLLAAEVRAQAAGKFANPALAVKVLDLDEEDIFDADGDIKSAAITKAIDTFLGRDENQGLRAGTTRAGGSSDAGRGTPAGTGDMNDLIRRAAGRT